MSNWNIIHEPTSIHQHFNIWKIFNNYGSVVLYHPMAPFVSVPLLAWVPGSLHVHGAMEIRHGPDRGWAFVWIKRPKPWCFPSCVLSKNQVKPSFFDWINKDFFCFPGVLVGFSQNNHPLFEECFLLQIQGELFHLFVVQVFHTANDKIDWWSHQSTKSIQNPTGVLPGCWFLLFMSHAMLPFCCPRPKITTKWRGGRPGSLRRGHGSRSPGGRSSWGTKRPRVGRLERPSKVSSTSMRVRYAWDIQVLFIVFRNWC